jgi:hypothetical protein
MISIQNNLSMNYRQTILSDVEYTRTPKYRNFRHTKGDYNADLR